MPHENLKLPLRDINCVRMNNTAMPKHNEKKENLVGPVIDRRLRELGKTQHWLAETVDLSPVSVHNWIKTGKIARENIAPVAMALCITTSELMGEAQQNVMAQTACPARPSLHYILPDEERLLEHYRLCSDDRKALILSMLEAAAKKVDGEPTAGPRRAA